MRLALALLVAATLAGCKGEADFSDNLQVRQLSAEAYQQEIVTVDQLVFREAPLGEDGARSLEATLDAMAKRVAATDPNSKFLKVESDELQLLAKRAGRLSPRELQDNWMRIRNNLFDDRAWFARSAADLDDEARTASTTPASAVALSGRWRVVSVVANGQPREDSEMSRSIWDFELPKLTIQDGTGKTKTYSCGLDHGYLGLISADGEGWAKYEITSDGLRIAFFDGLKGKPEGFDWSGQKDPMLIALRLVAVR